MRIALAGNPNSGKTTMFNALTGSNEHVGNWAGVTVDKKEAKLKRSIKEYKNQLGHNEEITIVDLPGAYSISPYTSEESITSEYVKESNPDVIINIVDASNLSRSLFFTTQLLELNIPMIVALNKSDINIKKKTKINVTKLSQKLNCKVHETVSIDGVGLDELIDEAIMLVGTNQLSSFSFKNDDKLRFDFVDRILSEVETKIVNANALTIHDKIDNFLTNRFIGLPIFAIIMFLVFWISQVGPGVWIAEGIEFKNGFTIPGLATLLTSFQDFIASILKNDAGELSIWGSLLVDGIIGGVIAVIGFLPLVMVMYFLIALLEDCGYMARVSVILDPIFKKVGLSGKSVIPFVIGTGCAIPGVMACRTIRDERERRATAMLAPFMPCGAKLPVIALFAGVFFGKSTWVGPLMYFVGIVIILVGALIVNAITANNKKRTYFIMELPEYKVPGFGKAAKAMLDRGCAYIVKAGTIILVCNFTIHIMQTFNWNFEVVDASESILHDIAIPFAYIFAPIVGIVAWQLAAAIITGFIAKENVVGTLAVCYGVTNFINVDELILESGALEVQAIFGITSVAALAYLMFNLFSPPCFAAIGAMNAELKSKKWLFAGICLQLAMGYFVSFLVSFFGTLFLTGKVSSVWMAILGWIIVIIIVLIVTYLIINNQKKYQKE